MTDRFRLIEVPEGCRAVFVSNQLIAQFAKWTPVVGEAKVVTTEDPLVIDVLMRRTESS